MPDYLVSYDLKGTTPAPHKAFLTEAERQGWLYVLRGSDVFRLPNTTLWGVFDTEKAASEAFERARAAASTAIGIRVVVEKKVIAQMEDWTAASDRRKAPEPTLVGRSLFETCRNHQLRDPFFK